jgi:demethylmenaquinone methyltransferase/2-methoxy-6-polyprenyl-1,4-benzoquinol methylase
MAASETDKPSDESGTTHFGYQEVPVAEKQERVAEVFRSVANRYDMMNDVMSLGTHRLIKRFTIELSALRKGHKVLDLAGGTGDLSMRFSPIVGNEGQVVLADINEAMLAVGRDRVIDRGMQSNITFTQADAQNLPFCNRHLRLRLHCLRSSQCHPQRPGTNLYSARAEAGWQTAGAGVFQTPKPVALQGL